MTLAGDQARVSVLVSVPPQVAFEVFTLEIDQWWRRGLKYRVAGLKRGFVHLESGIGGRLFESFESADGTRVIETGRITAWEPPARFAFDWRAVNFAQHESTQVEVQFTASASGTLVTITHSGFAKLRADHPVRHGLAVTAFIRSMGMWWGELMSALREHIQTHHPRSES